MPNVSIFLMSIRIDFIVLIVLSIKCLIPPLFQKFLFQRQTIAHLIIALFCLFVLMLPNIQNMLLYINRVMPPTNVYFCVGL